MPSSSIVTTQNESAGALALRVAELQAVLKSQRQQLDEQKTIMEHNRTTLLESQELLRSQESQLLERDAQLQAQNAEIRALRRQHTLDAEALREAHMQLESRRRPSGAMGKLKGGARSGSGAPTSPGPTGSPLKLKAATSPTSNATMKQLQQALADKLVLVRALHQLTSEMATARCALTRSLVHHMRVCGPR